MVEQLKSPLSVRNIPAGLKSCIFHGYGSWFDAIAKGRHDIFHKLKAKLEQEGMSVYLAEGDGRASKALLAEDHLHIIVGGPAMFGPNILHAYPSYLWGFWYLDEIGHSWNSSVRLAQYNPDEIDREKAKFFFDGVSGFMLRENVSKLRQEPRMDAPLRPASATILCQNIETSKPRAHYLTTEDMIAAAAGFDRDAVVYVKPHPLQGKAGRRHILEICKDFPNVKLSDASIHDLIEAARVVITQNSSAGFEALMQKKPVITCAKSDYWHATLTPKNLSDLRAAIEFGPETMSDFDFEGYFYWFLERQCLEPAKEGFEARAWMRIRDKLMLD